MNRKTTATPFLKLLSVMLFFVVLSSVPYWAAFTHAPAGKIFQGSFQADDNTTSYYSFIRQYQDGKILADNLLTPEANKGVYFNFEWYLIGNISRVTGQDFNRTFQVWRVISICMFIAALYLVTGLVDAGVNSRLAGVFIFCLSGGFGWVFVLLDKLGIYRPEVGWWQSTPYPGDVTGGFYPISQMIIFPHFSFSISLVLLCLYLFTKGLQSGRKLYFLLASLPNMLVWLSRPYDGLTLDTIIVVYVLLDGLTTKRPLKDWLPPLIPAALSLPVVVYNYLSLLSSPGFRTWGKQAVVPPQLPLDLAVSLGGIGVLFLYCLKFARGFFSKDPALKVSLISVAVALLWIYSFPIFVFSRQFTAILTTLIFLYCFTCIMCYTKFPREAVLKAVPVVILLVLVNSLSTAYRLADLTQRALHGVGAVDTEVAVAYDWFGKNAGEDDTVLCAFETSIYLFRHGGNRVFVGHHSQTIGFEDKKRDVDVFFDQKTGMDIRADLVKRYNIKYVFYGENEKRLGGFDPGTAPFLVKEFEDSKASIFKVVGL